MEDISYHYLEDTICFTGCQALGDVTINKQKQKERRKDMKTKLICLISGTKKNGRGKWYKASLLGHNDEGMPITADFFLPEEVGEKLIKDKLIEDVDVDVTLGFDNYLRPTITGMSRVSSSGKGV